jgi:isopentenyldiphosphate isomerase
MSILIPNPNEISDVKWVSEEELEAMLIDEEQTEGIIAPWFRCIAARIMMKNGGTLSVMQMPSLSWSTDQSTTWVM